MKRVFYTTLLVLLSFTTVQTVFSQAGVLDPNDPDVVFTSSNQPPAPAWGVISKWGHTNRLSWNPYSYGYKSYIFHGMAFRLKFPKSYQEGVADGKKYPVFIFLHGLGEFAPIYDNEIQLIHGGQLHAQKVNDGTFDGFLLYGQSTNGYMSGNMGNVNALLDSMIKYVKADRDRVILSGLSSGGQSDWTYLQEHSEIYASAAIISAANVQDRDLVPSLQSIPMWLANGGKDRAPTPDLVDALVDIYKDLGGEIRHSFFPEQGHGVWNSFWNTPGYFDYLNAAHKAQPVVLFQHNEFCPNDPVNAQMILQPDFYQYEWQKDGVTIPEATTSSYTATEYGTYRARFKRKSTSEWSDWSPRPIVVSQKEATVTPPILIDGLHSHVLPAPDGSTTVPLKVPDNYTSYDWRNVSNNALVSTTNILDAPIGQFKVQVTEQYGCSSSYSDPFIVVPASGTNAPDKATDLTAITLTNTSVELFWNENPSPIYNETAFEVYRSKTSGSNYQLVSILPADVTTYEDNNLQPDIKYYYIVRAVNENGAAPNSNEANAKTKSDNTPPEAPQNLTITSSTRHSISLAWNEANDDVGVVKYDLYIKGVKAYTTDQTQFLVNNLDSFTSYSFYVRALDFAGNVSVPSSQVSGFTKFSGLNYKLYSGTWDKLPDFNALTPVQTGATDIVDISVSPYDDHFGMLWEGYIRIPNSGNYTFYIASDDGSKLYFNETYSDEATATIDNDGLHGTVEKSSQDMYLTAGIYPIAVTFFEKTGGQSMTLSWKSSDAGFSNKTEIPAEYFGDNVTLTGNVPAKPSDLLAVATAYDSVHLTWTDESADETGFEIYRKGGGETLFTMIGLVPANSTIFYDTLVTGSTEYSYAIQAVNTFGASGFNTDDLSGISYKYYEGTWSSLPDFDNLTSLSTGSLDNFSIAPRLSNDYFGFKYSGTIDIPTDGTYTFYTTSDEGSKLYIDTFDGNGQVVNNDGRHSARERSGDIMLIAGPHRIFVTYFERTGSQVLEVRWSGPGFNKALIPDSALKNTRTTITTPPLPAIPDVPVIVELNPLSAKSVSVTFKDYSTQTGYEVYRAMDDISNFRLYKVLDIADDSVTVNDTSLYANTKYYYKVRAFGIAGYSDFSDIDSVVTLNSLPVIIQISDRDIYYAGTSTIAVLATDQDGDQMSFTFHGLPAFASISNIGDGSSEIVFAPAISDLGNYPIKAVVEDGKGGKDSAIFNVTVSTNRPPSFGGIRPLVVAEGTSLMTPLFAIDPDRHTTLKYEMVNAPAFAELRTVSNNKGSLYLSPGYADAGEYILRLLVTDGDGGVDSIDVKVTVIDTPPQSQEIYVSVLNSGNTPVASPWNNISGLTTTGLLGSHQQTTTTGINFLTTQWNTFNLGAVTNNNSGIYPDDVIRDYYFFGAYGIPDTIRLNITGLDITGNYSVDLFGSSTYSSGATVYIIDGQAKSLEAGSNSQNIVSFKGLAPDANGNILVTMAKGTGVQLGYLNALVIKKAFDDGTIPVAPGNLAGTPLPNGSVLLKWKDIAYNEEGYSIMKSSSPESGFTIINPGDNNPNDSTYIDSNSPGNQTFYYKIFAHNQHGNSDTIGPVQITINNRIPQMQSVPSVYLRTGDNTDINLSATDDPGESLAFTAVGLPSFATLQDNGDGTATIHVSPENGEEGFYKNIEVRVEDNFGGLATTHFSISVSTSGLRTVYLNFGPANASPEPAPWNNFLAYPSSGAQVANLKDDANQNTGYNFILNTQLSTTSNYGMTDNNKGIYPDNVLATSVMTNKSTSASFQFANLNQSRKYNIAILCNLNAGSVDSGTFSSGGQTVSINGAYNTTRTVQLNGLTPDGSGKIVVTFTKSANSEYLNINAIIVQEYSGTPILAPGDLFTYTTLTTSGVRMTWSDRSTDETGFQIWRSTSPQTGFVQVGTASADTTSYMDNSASLVPGTVYYYKVRAKRGSEYSSFSNVSRFGLATNVVLLNFNAKLENHQPLPWNNTDDGPSMEGLVIDNLMNTNIQNTGFQMEITKHFNGVGYAGVPGAFPDNVITTNYWTDAAMVSEIKFANLDQRQKYRIGVLASVDRSGYYFGRYTINGVTKEVNNYINSFKVIYFDNISPDENGEIYVSVTPNEASAYCFTSAFTLENYENSKDAGDDIMRNGNSVDMGKGGKAREAEAISANQPDIFAQDNQPAVVSVRAYPNPFTTHVQVQITGLSIGKDATVEMYDIKSNLIYRTLIPAGKLQSSGTTLDIPIAQSIPAGTYILKVYNQDNQKSSLKLIKVN